MSDTISIGKYVMSYMKKMETMSLFCEKNINELSDRKWCKENLGMDYPYLKLLDKKTPEALQRYYKPNDTKARYYSNEYIVFNKKEYLISSELYEMSDNKKRNEFILFYHWFKDYDLDLLDEIDLDNCSKTFRNWVLEYLSIIGVEYVPRVEKSNSICEGSVMRVTVNRYERSPINRKNCIEHFKRKNEGNVKCEICGYQSKVVFGDDCKELIHVHHLKPLSECSEEYEVDPVKDLIPVCPNCHMFIHSKRPAYSIKEVREIISQMSE